MKSCESAFSKCLYFSSQALARKVEKLAIESWKPTGLSPSHAYLLILVLREPGLQPTTVGEQLQLTPSTITRLVEKLHPILTCLLHWFDQSSYCNHHLCLYYCAKDVQHGIIYLED